jgi:PAS domain S-box-containing protein
MLDALTNWLFDPSGLTPHGFCLLWEPWLISLHATSDAAIGLAYFTIPMALFVFARRRRDMAFRPVFLLFATFILLCGTGHWFDLMTLWVPAYGAEGLVKAATAIISILTAAALWWLLPQALALPSPEQLRQANTALSQSEERHRASFEHSPVPMHILDGNGVITAVSDSWLELLGYTTQQVIGQPIDSICDASADGWTTGESGPSLAQGQSRDVERRFRCHDGGLIDTLVSSRLERRGDVVWVVCVVIDITARRQAEAALHASEDRLRHAQKMEAVGHLTGGIAHDFNNMLQGISGALELMEYRVQDERPEELQHYIDAARQSVDRAAGLTSRMLAFARRQALVPTALNPDALIRGMAELIERTVGPSIQLEMHLLDRPVSALCDANQLENALLNLAINARDAMPDGGHLVITTAPRALDGAPGGAATGDAGEVTPGDYVEITVSDTGTGMPPDVLAHAFEPFFTTKPIGRGTGLGLSQLYGFVRQSGGTVQLESTPGKGTTVRLFLPCPAQPVDTAEAPTRALARKPGIATAGVVGRKVLVVEDEDNVRSLIVETLERFGCRVLQAGDGPAGLDIMQSGQPIDLLITDVGLPGLNGRQLAEACQAVRPGLPVLLITGYAGNALEDLPHGHGMAILRKPFSLDTFTTQVLQMLATHSQSVVAQEAGPAAL